MFNFFNDKHFFWPIQNGTFSIMLCSNLVHFPASALKIFPLKKILIFLPEKCPMFSQKKLFLYFRKWNFLIFWKTKLSNPKTKKIQKETFQSQKIIKKTLWKKLYLGKWNFLATRLETAIFQEGTWQSLRIKISYISFHIFCLLRENFSKAQNKSFLYFPL